MQVVAPAPGGPAEKAGIKPLDTVVAIDGRNTKGISLFEAGDLLQGEDGSQVQPIPLLLNPGGSFRCSTATTGDTCAVLLYAAPVHVCLPAVPILRQPPAACASARLVVCQQGPATKLQPQCAGQASAEGWSLMRAGSLMRSP